jgi:hypothetical protein
MASDNGSGGVGLFGVVVTAFLVAIFAYFLIGDRLGLREPVSSGDVRIEAARVPVQLPAPERR